MSDRKITVKSGNEEFKMSVTEEEYRNYFRPWWQQKKHEQRNREAMEQNGYTEESYEEWKENDMRTELFAESMEELAEKRMLLGVLQDAMDSLLPEERELAMKVFGEEMPLADYADMKGKNPRTLSDHKRKVLSKLGNWRSFRMGISSFCSRSITLYWSFSVAGRRKTLQICAAMVKFTLYSCFVSFFSMTAQLTSISVMLYAIRFAHISCLTYSGL